MSKIFYVDNVPFLIPERVTKIGIVRVIFNAPATIVFWSDGKKTVIKAKNEPYDSEKGLAMAIAKRVLGNSGRYYNEFKKWLPKKEDKNETN